MPWCYPVHFGDDQVMGHEYLLGGLPYMVTFKADAEGIRRGYLVDTATVTVGITTFGGVIVDIPTTVHRVLS